MSADQRVPPDAPRRIGPTTRHVLQFRPQAIAGGRSANYILEGRVALHVMVRASDSAVVIDDMAMGRWLGPLMLPLPAEALQGGVAVTLSFGPDGVMVQADGATPRLFDRCRAIGATLALRLPAGIGFSEQEAEAEPADSAVENPPPEAPDAPAEEVAEAPPDAAGAEPAAHAGPCPAQPDRHIAEDAPAAGIDPADAAPAEAPSLLHLPVILVAATDRDALQPMLDLLGGAAIAVAALRDVQDEALVLDTPEGDRLLPAPPPACLGLIAASQPGYAVLRQAAAWLAERGVDAPAPILPGPDDMAEAFAGIAAAALSALRGQQVLLADSLTALATLRQVRDDQQMRLAALEDVLARRNLQPFSLAFEEAPATDRAELALGGPGRPVAVTQLLPVASRGVSAIALHVAAPAAAGAALEVALDSLEDGAPRGRWTVPLDDISSGWVVLGLRHGLTGLNRSLRLSVALREGAGRVSLSLGPPQPLPAFRVAEPAGEAAARALAFRVWAGLPGLPAPFPSADHAELDADVTLGFEEVPLDPGGFRLPHAEATGGTPALLHLPREEVVAVQAPPQGMAVAQLPGSLPASAVVASARIAIERPDAPTLCIALAGGSDLEALQALAASGGPPAAGWSGWVTLAGGNAATVTLYLPARPGPARDLLVFVALAEPGPNDAAWVRVGALSATVRMATDTPDAPPQEAAPPPAAIAAAPHPAPIPAPAPSPSPVPVRPAGTLVPVQHFEGSGFHEVESAESRTWRWFSPDALLLLRRQPADLGGVALLVSSTAPGVTLERLMVSVNGVDVPIRVLAAEGGGMEVLIPVPAPLVPRDGRVAIRIAADAAFTAPGDARALALVCTGLRLGTA